MKKSKLWIAVLASVFAVSTVFTGCNSKDDKNSSNASSDLSSNSSTITAPDDNNMNSNSANNESKPDSNFSLTDTIEGVYRDIMNGADDWLAEMDMNTMKTGYGIDFSNFEEYYGRIPKANVHATTVIGVKAKEGKKEEARAELMKYQQAMVKNFERYLPEQYDIVKDYRIVENGDYMVLVIAENADDVEKAVEEAFQNLK